MDDARWTTRWMVPICAGVMLVVYSIYYHLLAPEHFRADAEGLRELKHLVLWGSSSLVLSLVILWCLGVSLLVIRNYHRLLRQTESWAVAVIGGIVFAGMLVVLFGSSDFLGSEASGTILRPLFKAKPHVYGVVYANNALGIALTLSVLTACILVSRRVSSCSAAELGERIRWFRTLLYSAGVFLAALIYEVFRLFQWGASLTPGGDERTGLASSLTLASGLISSAFMVLVFLPEAIQLDHRERYSSARPPLMTRRSTKPSGPWSTASRDRH
jgi:hypothetical protein